MDGSIAGISSKLLFLIFVRFFKKREFILFFLKMILRIGKTE